LLGLAADTVPNVRLVLARTLRRVVRSHYLTGEGTAEETIVATLERLGGDTDKDVVYFSADPDVAAAARKKAGRNGMATRAPASIPTV
jgi:hypothetical protein